MSYQYRGTIHDVTAPVQPTYTNCGTRAGYRRHQNNNTLACDNCRAAHNEYMIRYQRTRRAA